MLHCGARAAAAATGIQAGDEQEQQQHQQNVFIQDALKLVESYPQHYHAVYAAAETLQRAASGKTSKTVEKLLSADAMLQLAPLLAANLAHPGAPLRVATLRVLCSFRQPDSLPSSDEDKTPKEAPTTLPASDVLKQLLLVHSRQLGGRWRSPCYCRSRSCENAFRIPSRA